MTRELGVAVLLKIESEAELMALKSAGIRPFRRHHFAWPRISVLPAMRLAAAVSMAA
jgi:hypothetical protein